LEAWKKESELNLTQANGMRPAVKGQSQSSRDIKACKGNNALLLSRERGSYQGLSTKSGAPVTVECVNDGEYQYSTCKQSLPQMWMSAPTRLMAASDSLPTTGSNEDYSVSKELQSIGWAVA
jgi:hypothetical protein